MSDNSTPVFTLYHVFIWGSRWFLIKLLYICNSLYFSFWVERTWIFLQRNYECSQSSRTPGLISPHFHWWCPAPFRIPVLVQGKGLQNASSSQWQGLDCIPFALGESSYSPTVLESSYSPFFPNLSEMSIRPLSGQIPEILSCVQFCKKCDWLSLFPSVASESYIMLVREAARKKLEYKDLYQKVENRAEPHLSSLAFPNCKFAQKREARWFLRYFL